MTCGWVPVSTWDHSRRRDEHGRGKCTKCLLSFRSSKEPQISQEASTPCLSSLAGSGLKSKGEKDYTQWNLPGEIRLSAQTWTELETEATWYSASILATVFIKNPFSRHSVFTTLHSTCHPVTITLCEICHPRPAQLSVRSNILSLTQH